MNNLPTLDPAFVAEVIKEVKRVFHPGTHVKDTTLLFGVDHFWIQSERDLLADAVLKEINCYEYPRQVRISMPFPDPSGQRRVFVHIFNDSNASGQELAPK